MLYEKEKQILLQKENINFFEKNLGHEVWTQVCGHKKMNGTDAGFWCGFIPKKNIEMLLKDSEWNINPNNQGEPGFVSSINEYEYQTNLLEYGMESLIFYRDFYGVKSDYVELSQEFILLNNLRYETSTHSYLAMYDSGESEEAVKYIDNTTILVNIRFLKRYASAKQMAIIFFFESKAQCSGKLSDYGLKEFNDNYQTEGLLFSLWSGDMTCPDYAYSVLRGKRIIMPPPVEKCDIWPYKKEKHFEEFIIGVDECGNEIEYSCNPNMLANRFGANPTAPMYLTPVFFKKEVLQKYYSKSELYEIRDGYLNCKHLWGIKIDNHHENCISAYLGDIGKYLPENDQIYWKSYNIVGDGRLSLVAFQRDFCNLPVDSDMADHQFVRHYVSISKRWKEKYHWPIFLPLKDEDRYNLSQIRIPITDSQSEFDQLVLFLTKILIDSLNEAELKRDLSLEPNTKGIGKLAVWLQSKHVVNYQNHIQFLKNLQELRSTGTGHRKGKSYDRISKTFELDRKTRPEVFEKILMQASDFLIFLESKML